MLRRLKTPTPWVLLAFGGGVVTLHQWVTAIGGPEVIEERYGLTAPLMMVAIQTVLSAAPFPSELWALASAAAYGWLWGSVMTWAGWTMGSMIQYGLARRGVDDLAASREPSPQARAASDDASEANRRPSALDDRLDRLPRWLRRFPLTHPVFLVVVRWFPMGFHLANVLAGARRVPAAKQLAIAAIGSVPGAIIWAAIGAGAARGLS